jgi:hypothetical protein
MGAVVIKKAGVEKGLYQKESLQDETLWFVQEKQAGGHR